MRTSIACEGLTEQLLDGTSPSWRAIQQKRIWWIWPSWLRRQIVALKIVGSSPIIHPIKITPSVRMVLFLWNPVNNGTRRERPARRAGKKVSGGHFFSSGESPIIHPIKEKHPYAGAFLLWNPVNDGSRRERPARRAGKKVSGGLIFSSGESSIIHPR